ncbi:hypothetical protein ES288_A13G256300v1 [Gossypium darwinii]|uniref:FAD/NAD(P)-binding domain-containing protein n=1 Tax=Gossypium darwinii TaxID=34276 RepID=A0A5D2E3C0_GOSDA|nr:hypothetical protein ES288_A13G256300v1 [Gossypium darwinii]
MSFTLPRYFLRFHFNFTARTESTRAKNNHGYLFLAPKANTAKFTTASIPGDKPQKLSAEELLVVVGGGAAGVYGAIRAKTVASNLNVLVIEKGKLLSKVLADHYPRGNKELRGSFFNVHGPTDTMSWFVDKGVDLNTEDDGRVFPGRYVSLPANHNNRLSCSRFSFFLEYPCSGTCLATISLQTGKLVTSASASASGKFLLKIEKRTLKSVELVEADYLLIASGSSQQGHNLAVQLGHSIVDPVPSLFTFKIEDAQLVELSGVTFSKVIVKLKLENVQRNIPQLTQVGPMLVTHWGLSGPAILRLSAWGARYLYSSGYKGKLSVDFVPDLHVEDLKSMLSQQKNRFLKQKVLNSCPMELQLIKRFWKYILDREGLVGDTLWASVSNSSIVSIANLLKHCTFEVKGKGQFKDEFVTAGGVPLSEIHLNTMESRIQPNLYFAGENAWSGGYIAGSTIGRLAAGNANLVGAL